MIGSEMVGSRKVDKISFTGETSTGKLIAAQAACAILPDRTILLPFQLAPAN